jgi:hypothetical protein
MRYWCNIAAPHAQQYARVGGLQEHEETAGYTYVYDGDGKRLIKCGGWPTQAFCCA